MSKAGGVLTLAQDRNGSGRFSLIIGAAKPASTLSMCEAEPSHSALLKNPSIIPTRYHAIYLRARCRSRERKHIRSF